MLGRVCHGGVKTIQNCYLQNRRFYYRIWLNSNALEDPFNAICDQETEDLPFK